MSEIRHSGKLMKPGNSLCQFFNLLADNSIKTLHKITMDSDQKRLKLAGSKRPNP